MKRFLLFSVVVFFGFNVFASEFVPTDPSSVERKPRRKIDSYQTLQISPTRSGSGSFISRITPEASVIGSTFTGTMASESFGAKTGFGAGILVDLGRSSYVFETGLLYRRLGTEVSGFYTDQNFIWSLNYLSLPLAMKYFFRGQDLTSLYLKLGVMPSMLLSEDMALGSTQQWTATYNNSVDLSGIIGVGVKVALSHSADLILEATYNPGLTRAFGPDTPFYNTSVAFTSGVALRL